MAFANEKHSYFKLLPLLHILKLTEKFSSLLVSLGYIYNSPKVGGGAESGLNGLYFIQIHMKNQKTQSKNYTFSCINLCNVNAWQHRQRSFYACSIVSDPLKHMGFPSKKTGMGYHFLLHGWSDLSHPGTELRLWCSQGSNPVSGRWILYQWVTGETQKNKSLWLLIK